jgi:LPXTG-site transpeptidase (sortase) family protein
MRYKTYKKIVVLNNLLAVCAAFACVYTVAYPFIPNIQWVAKKVFAKNLISLAFSDSKKDVKNNKAAATITQVLGASSGIDTTTEDTNLKLTSHVLTVNAMDLTTKILEGKDPSTLFNGIWRRPHTSTPDKGGNTVLTAHRFLYTSGNNTFYHLDKVKKDDVITITWEDKEYTYKVSETRVVNPDDISIEAPTKDATLTLYTCTPLWTSKERLVVIAKLIN